MAWTAIRPEPNGRVRLPPVVAGARRRRRRLATPNMHVRRLLAGRRCRRWDVCLLPGEPMGICAVYRSDGCHWPEKQVWLLVVVEILRVADACRVCLATALELILADLQLAVVGGPVTHCTGCVVATADNAAAIVCRRRFCNALQRAHPASCFCSVSFAGGGSGDIVWTAAAAPTINTSAAAATAPPPPPPPPAAAADTARDADAAAYFCRSVQREERHAVAYNEVVRPDGLPGDEIFAGVLYGVCADKPPLVGSSLPGRCRVIVICSCQRAVLWFVPFR